MSIYSLVNWSKYTYDHQKMLYTLKYVSHTKKYA